MQPAAKREPLKSLADRQEEINEAWQAAYAAAGENPQSAVLGIDLGGTGMKWSVYPVENGVVQEQEIAQSSIVTPKGILPLADGYEKVLNAAMQEAAQKGYVISGIGIGSPGRFITSKGYEDAGYQRERQDPFVPMAVGNLAQSYTPHKGVSWKPGAATVIANGSAENLSATPGEFNGLMLEPMLQRLSPLGVQVVVKNDAAIQLVGLVEDLKKDSSTREAVTGKKIIYMGPGTGMGAAVMDASGNVITDGHFQYTKMQKRSAEENDVAVYETIARIHQEKYKRIAEVAGLDEVPNAILPEDILCGTGIKNILQDIYGQEMTPEKFDQMYAKLPEGNDEKMQKAVARLQSVGRYYGDLMVTLHGGDFSHMDPRAEWPDADKKAIAGYDGVVFGGGMSRAKFFQDEIVPQAKEVIKGKGLGERISLLFPSRVEAAAKHAAAATISREALKIEPAQLRALNETLQTQRGGQGF